MFTTGCLRSVYYGLFKLFTTGCLRCVYYHERNIGGACLHYWHCNNAICVGGKGGGTVSLKEWDCVHKRVMSVIVNLVYCGSWCGAAPFCCLLCMTNFVVIFVFLLLICHVSIELLITGINNIA